MSFASKIAVAAVCVLAGAACADPVNVSFFNITNNGSQNAAAQFNVVVDEVIPGPGGRVSFRFTNTGAINSAISEVYFDDGTLLGISTLTQHASNGFVHGSASPGNLPSANSVTPSFNVTQGFLADAQGNPSLGVNNVPGDFLQINFNLINNKSFADTIASLQDGSLRIGMHVRAIGTQGNSDSFVNTPPQVIIPLPGASAMGLAGLFGIAAVRRRR